MSRKTKHGFTIVELLIAIVVIAILASISIVAYIGIQNRAYDSTVQSDAGAIAKHLELQKIDKGSYPIGAPYFPSDLHISKEAYSTSYNNVMYCMNKNTDKYALGLISKSEKAWLVVSGEVRSVSPVNIHTSACSAVGASWANDANSGASHGYNVNSGQWSPGWSLTE
jgi:prepilin-type N-terminal cleavage/methylation domain-containing protein